MDMLNTFGFDKYEAELSTWDGGASGKYDGTPEQWELAENALAARRRAAEHQGQGDARRGGVLRSEDRREAGGCDRPASGSSPPCSSISRCRARFDLEYIAEDGKKHQPLMVHRALYGSVERFFGILVEHYAGAFPVWLAPVQAIVLPITDRQLEYAHAVAASSWTTPGIRATVDDRKEKVNLKIREAQMQKIPYMLVVGDREAQNGQRVGAQPQAWRSGCEDASMISSREIHGLIESKAVSE